MPFKGLIDDTTLIQVANLRGHVWTTTVATGGALTAGGTGTTRVSLNSSYRVPDAARMLIGWMPYQNTTTPAVAKSQNGFFDIQGTNYKYQPQQVLTVGQSVGLSVGAPIQQPLEFWDTFIPVNGGETWDIGYTALSANSANSKVDATLYWTDVRLPFPVIYSQVGTNTAITASAAGTTAGSSFSINNARMMIEVGGMIYQNAAIVAAEEWNIQTTMQCTAWTPVQQVIFDMFPRTSPIVTSGECSEWSQRHYTRIEFTTDRATVTTTFYNNDTSTNGGNAVQYIRWI